LSYWDYYLISWDPGPLWFVEVLLVFTLVYALLRRRRGPVTAVHEPARAPGPVAIAALVVALGLVTAGVMLVVLTVFGHAFSWLDAPAAVKFLVVAALAVPLCWLASWPARSLPRADRVL
jgi:hypothetical protein